MAEWIHILCILSFIVHLAKTESYITFISDTELNHLTVDENTGFVYVGAVNHLYQLTRELGLSFNVSTGPKKDNKKCTPPIDQEQCPNAFLRDNYNKLLLLDVPKERIVVCGSLFKGICSLRKIINISEEISYDDSRGEKSFVASNDEKVETVGLIADMTDYGPRVLFVGKGTSLDDNGIIISTRILDEMGDNGSFETYHDSANLKYGSVSANTQQFITVFEDPDRVYFISSRLDKTSHKSRTLISRLCKSDYNYFSYVEMDLGCRDADNIPYNICTAAFLASPGQELADLMGLSSVQDKVLFGVFTTFINNQEKSAVCMFPLSKINQKFEQNREECYTSNKECANQDSECIFTKPFGEKISCGKQPSQAGESLKYPCGSEHLPYPLQSKNGVTENAVLFPERHPFTAIAVSVENEHTIAFLGTAEGELVKAYLGKSANQYRTVSFPTKSSVKNGMVFDALKEHLYVMTKRKVHRVPVQECQQYLDCNECIQAKDPYCGWCVIEGKCLRKAQCARANDPNHWLWSPGGVCMKIQSVSPSNMSINDLGEVKLTVEPPIKLHYDDKLMCNFGGNVQAALLDEDGSISCPRLETVPSTERGKDYVDVAITLHFLKDKNSVFFANYSYQFYNCEESAYISENVPCSSCVNAKWKCQWDVGLYKCVDFLGYTHETISMESSCPQFNDPKPQFIPMNRQTTITFSGMNLHLLQSENFIAGNDNLNPKLRSSIQKNGDTFSLTLPQFSIQDKEIVPLDIFILNKENEKKVDSKLNVKLYNCFFGRSDCSLCLAANAEYNCAWCDNKCAYEPTCNNSPVSECPAPYITDFQPKAAPVDGGILLTIMGSNLGVKSEDIEEISVAGVICTFRPDMYSVSTRVVCAVGRASKEKAGNIQIKVKGKEGVSPDSLTFSYQVHSGPRNRARGQRKRKKDGDGLSSSIPKRTISFCKKDCTEIS